MRKRIGGLGCLILLGLACRDDFRPGHSPQDLMAHGEPIAPSEGPAKAGDPGVISGRLTVLDTFAPSAQVQFGTVTLYRGDVAVAHAATDSRGEFLFLRTKDTGEYEIRVDSERFEGRRKFAFRSGQAARVDLVVHSKQGNTGPQK